MSRITALLFALSMAASAQSRPNIIFFLTDDLGYGDLGCFWQDQRTATKKFDTPGIDTMAAEGAKLTHHYIAASVCAPSRASLLQGRHQGHSDVRNSQFDKALPDTHSIGTVLQAAGYRTIHIGKGGLSGAENLPGLTGTGSQNLAAHPLHRGFDRFFGYLFHTDGHEHYPRNGTTDKDAFIYDDYQQVANASLDLYTTDAWTAAAKKEIIDEATDGDDQPFFLYLSYDSPHFKMQRPATAYPALDNDGDPLTGGIQWTTATDGSGRVRYASTANGTGTVDGYTHPDIPAAWATSEKQHVGMIRRIDESIADIIQTLKDLGIDGETLCIFSSDNGPHNEGKDPRSFESYANLEGIKRDLWEGGIRVPTIVRWPSNISGATNNPANIHEIDYPSANWDWMPTFCDLADVPAPAWCDGVSLLPTLTGTGTQRDKGYLYFEFQRNGGTTPLWSQFPNHGGDTQGEMQAIRIGNHMGVRTGISTGNENFLIYDVTTDPGQGTDLAASLPAVQAEMKALALTARRPGAGVTRPYDGLALPPPDPPAAATPGVNWKSYVDTGTTWQWVPEFRDLASTASGTGSTPDLSVRPADEHFGLLFTGWIEIPSAGSYTFYLDSDTGADFFLHDGHLIADDYAHSGTASAPAVNLSAGLHPFRLYYRHTTGTRTLALEWSGPGIARQAVPAPAFFIEGVIAPGPPVANDDEATTLIDAPVLIDVLANDTDDGTPSPIAIQSVGTPGFGTAIIVSGEIRYTPPAAFEGITTFDYTITDGADTDTATVTVHVVAQQAPVALDDEAETSGNATAAGVPVSIPVLANDSDPDGAPQPLFIESVGTPVGGVASISGDQIVYTPSAAFFGVDNFPYVVSDGAASVTAWVSVRVRTGPPANLTAWWDFEGNLVDSVSTTAGTAFGNASASGAALAPTGSNSLSLDGANDYVSSGTDGGLGGTGSFTVLAFVQTSANSDGTVFSHYNSNTGGTGLRLIVQADGDLRIEMNDGARFELNTPGNLNDGAVHMIAAVFDSGTGDSFRDVNLYVDGMLYDVTGGTDHPVNLATSTDLRFGTDQSGGRDFNGLIDGLAIYDEALSLAALDGVRTNGFINEPTLFSTWVADPAFNVAPADRGFDDDPDGDGKGNGLEYYFGTDPGKADGSGLIVGEYMPGANPTFTFTHPINGESTGDVIPSYRWSTDLSNYYDDGGSNGPGTTTVTFSEPVPAGDVFSVTATVTGSVIPSRLFVVIEVTHQ